MLRPNGSRLPASHVMIVPPVSKPIVPGDN
jgi:hypothetical protein